MSSSSVKASSKKKSTLLSPTPKLVSVNSHHLSIEILPAYDIYKLDFQNLQSGLDQDMMRVNILLSIVPLLCTPFSLRGVAPHTFDVCIHTCTCMLLCGHLTKPGLLNQSQVTNSQLSVLFNVRVYAHCTYCSQIVLNIFRQVPVLSLSALISFMSLLTSSCLVEKLQQIFSHGCYISSTC